MGIKADLTNDIAVKALRWKEGNPNQFEVKDKLRKGYYLRVSKGGTRHWYYRYTKNKNLRSFSLGTYPQVTCAMAFKAYEDAVEQVRHGNDPFLDRKQVEESKRKKSEKDSFTLSVLFHKHYFPRYSKPNLRTWINDQTYFETKIEPAFGDLPVADVTPLHVEKLILPMERGGHYATARLTLATLRKIYNWAAISNSAVNPGDGPLFDVLNPCRQYKLGKKPPSPDRFLANDEIGMLWKALGSSQVGRICKLQILTGCRVSEAAGMKWDELNSREETWICPKERVRNKKRPLVLPLTERMTKIIGVQNDSAFVFPSKSALGHILGSSVWHRVTAISQELGMKKVGTHTMRKTFITNMARLGVNLEIRNSLTNHIDSSVDAVSYNFYDYYDEKKDALGRWDKEISQIIAS